MFYRNPLSKLIRLPCLGFLSSILANTRRSRDDCAKEKGPPLAQQGQLYGVSRLVAAGKPEGANCEDGKAHCQCGHEPLLGYNFHLMRELCEPECRGHPTDDGQGYGCCRIGFHLFLLG